MKKSLQPKWTIQATDAPEQKFAHIQNKVLETAGDLLVNPSFGLDGDDGIYGDNLPDILKEAENEKIHFFKSSFDIFDNASSHLELGTRMVLNFKVSFQLTGNRPIRPKIG